MAKTKRYDGPQHRKLFYYLVGFLGMIWFRLRHPRLKVDKRCLKGIKPPYLLICNHLSNMDYQVCAFGLFPRKIHFVAAATFFQRKALRWALHAVGAISKLQFQPDLSAIKQMMAALKNGGIVALYPEGQVGPDGHNSGYVNPAVGKLVKSFRVPVMLAYVQGTYNVCPKWRQKKLSKGPMFYRISPLFTREEIGCLSAEEICRGIIEKIQGHDPTWAKEHHYRYPGKGRAEGLEHVLYQCPRCKTEFLMKGQGDRLLCTACGNAVVMDDYQMLHPVEEACFSFATVHDWCMWQKDQIRESYVQDPFHIFGAQTRFRMVEGDSFQKESTGEGILRYEKRGITYQGTSSLERVEYFFPQKKLECLPFLPGEYFEVGMDRKIYAFHPAVPSQVLKWVFICDVLRELALAEADLLRKESFEVKE